MSDNAQGPDWAAIEPHLDQALELDAARREAWLVELSILQPGIAQAVRGLLARCDALNAAGFLSKSLFAGAADATPVWREILEQQALYETGERSLASSALDALGLKADAVVGPYRLIRQVGRGGMSSVWLAERCDGQLKRAVALKLPFIGAHGHE